MPPMPRALPALLPPPWQPLRRLHDVWLPNLGHHGTAVYRYL
jgi:hypothetical protein